MSWTASAIVTDADTTALEEVIAKNNALYMPPPNDAMLAQQEFAVSIVQEAFEAEVVEGTYNVSLNGHSNPDQENDRKSLGISFSPTVIAQAVE